MSESQCHPDVRHLTDEHTHHGPACKNSASGTFVQLNQPSRKYMPVPLQERVRLESELREHGFQQSKWWAIWEFISDYRNRLVICFVVVFVLMGLVTVLAVKHWNRESTPSQHPLLLEDRQSIHAHAAPQSNVSFSKNASSLADVSNAGLFNILLNIDTERPSANEESKSPQTVFINSWKEIHMLNYSARAIRIQSLESRVGWVPLGPQNNTTVHTLILDASITEDDVNRVLMQFSKITKLIVNMDQLCDGSNHITPALTAPLLNITSVERLRLVNCYDCPVVDWVLKSRIKLVKRLELCNCNINKRMHDLMKKFMHQPQGDFKVKIGMLHTQNELCKECLFDKDELGEDQETEELNSGSDKRQCFM